MKKNNFNNLQYQLSLKIRYSNIFRCMKRSLYSILFVCIIISCIYFVIQGQTNVYENNMTRYAQKIIVTIDDYYLKKQQMPTSLQELFPEEKAIEDVFTISFDSADNYILQFTLKDNRIKSYYSSTKNWRIENEKKKK